MSRKNRVLDKKMSNETVERYRLVVLGSGQVGKTCIIKRFLHNVFNDRYKETVEDIFSRDFHIHGALLPLDVYDTNYSYPDMRRLSIASANAFLFVFAADNVNSFKAVTELMQEVFDRRPEATYMPLILAGNKMDTDQKKIYPETVHAWLSHFPHRKDIKYLEVSAKTGENIREIFKALLDISGFPYKMKQDEQDSLSPHISRRQNMSQRSRSPGRRRDALLPQSSDQQGRDEGDDEQTPKKDYLAVKTRLSRTLSRKEQKEGGSAVFEASDKGFTRHASLIRRTNRMSLKIKQADADLPDESDCKIS